MSLDIRVYGVSDSDKIDKAREAKDILNKLGIDYPEELDDIIESEIEVPVTLMESEYSEGYAVNVKDIPNNIETLIFKVDY